MPLREAEYFLAHSIDQWRRSKEVNLKNEKFVLIGHSWGGFLAAAYAIHFRKNLEKLLLWSPLLGRPSSFLEQKIVPQDFLTRQIFKITDYNLENKLSPVFWSLKNIPGFAWMTKKLLINRFQTTNLPNLTKIGPELVVDYVMSGLEILEGTENVPFMF